MRSAQPKAAPISLLLTKLHRPRITEDLVPRAQLLDRLNRRRQRRLTLVSASAGYGKTTLISSWLASVDGLAPPVPNAWLSLDGDDNDLRTFLSYFLVAIRTMFPDAGHETLDLLGGPSLPPLQVLSHSLINEFPEYRDAIHDLKTSNNHFARLFDQYHHVDKEVHRIEEGVENTSDFYLEDLKKKRLHLKDEMYGMIKSSSMLKLA